MLSRYFLIASVYFFEFTEQLNERCTGPRKKLKNMVWVSASNSRGKLTTMKSRVIVQKLLPLEGDFFPVYSIKKNE